MDASVGSEPDTKSKSLLLSASYNYFIWFLIGCLSHFGLQIFILSSSIFTDVLEIPNKYCGSFLANMVALAIISSYLGFVISHIFFPLNKVTIEFSFIIACLSLVMMCIVNLIHKRYGKILYILSILVGCFCFGVVETVGITSASDPELAGRASKRVVFFLCGHPIGYFLVLLIHLLIENNYFSHYINSCGFVGAIYSCYAIIVLVFLGSPIVAFILNHLYPLTLKKIKWKHSNIFNSLIYYSEAFGLLKNYKHYIIILTIIETAEIVLNLRLVLFLHDPYPKFDSIICSISIVIGYALFDFMGRGFAIAIRRMVSDLRDRNKIMLAISKANYSKTNETYVISTESTAANNIDNVEAGNKTKIDLDPEIKYKFRIWLYKGFLIFTWLPISFRIITGTLMAIQRHFPESLALRNYTNLQGTIMLTMINAFIRGIIVSYVYSNLFETSKNDYLEEINVSIYPKDNEPKECIDMRYNANLTAALVVSLVRLIHLSILLILTYVFYKYNRLLFEASEVYKKEKRWPTDHLDIYLYKILWWIENIFKLIWRDIRSPFDLMD